VARAGHRGVALGRRLADWAAKLLSVGCAVACVFCLALILGYLVWQGVSGLSWDFFTKLPGPSGRPSGMRNCIVGSVLLVGMASLIGVPAGMACGVWLCEFGRRSRVGAVVRTLVDVLAGVPSIVVGVVAYELVVVPMGHFSGFAGALGLALLMCPIIARTTEEMLRLVPDALREASLGAGATTAQTIVRVVLPAAASGIITGVVLAVARVAGETAPLLFTALGNDGSVLDPRQPFPALTLKIFSYATSPEAEWKRQAWAGMLVLIVLILVLNLAMRTVARPRLGKSA
jgi:phosphate transport system permease protein